MEDMATRKKAADETMGRQIGVRLTEEDHARLEALAVKLSASVTWSVSTIARAALLVGLDIIEAQPGVLLGEKPRPQRRGNQ